MASLSSCFSGRSGGFSIADRLHCCCSMARRTSSGAKSEYENPEDALREDQAVLRHWHRLGSCWRSSRRDSRAFKSDLFGVLGQREESEIPEPAGRESSDEKEISGKNMLIAAISNLFEVARDQGIYVPTRDTPTSGHFKFVKFYYGVLVDYAQSIRSIDDEVDIGLGYREIVRGMSLVLEIDHRAVDDGVEAFWLTLLSATAIRSGDESAVAEAIAAGCRMLKISGELRNVDAIPRLFSCVKPIERFQLGLQRFFCDASFLESLRKMIETMPEAQSAEIVNMVSRFASETLTTLDTAEIAAVAASGEIQGQILENLKVSSTNAYQVGVNVRTIVDSVVADPLRQLLVKVANGKRSDRLGLRSFYLIRLYLTCRMLHRQCISMMSPEKAAAAAAAAHEFHLDSLELDWIEVALEQQELSIFAWIGQSTAVLAVVNGLLQGSGKNSFPSLYYLTDLLAIQRLADLQRYIHSVEYFDAKLTTSSVEDPVLSSIDAEDQTGDSSRKNLQQLLPDFKISQSL